MKPEELRELNIAVGERVMGWQRVWAIGYKTSPVFLGGHFDSEDACRDACVEDWRGQQVPRMLWSRGGQTWGVGEEWSPATDMGAAWQVVEAINRLGLAVSVTSYAEPEHEVRIQGYRDYFTHRDDAREWVEYAPEWGESVPEVICRAALKALEKNHA